MVECAETVGGSCKIIQNNNNVGEKNTNENDEQ
jgi:hypothetical protein